MVHPDSKITVKDLFQIRKSNIEHKSTFESLTIPQNTATKLYRVGKKIEIDIFIGPLFTKIGVVGYPPFSIYAPKVDRPIREGDEHWSEDLCNLIGL